MTLLFKMYGLTYCGKAVYWFFTFTFISIFKLFLIYYLFNLIYSLFFIFWGGNCSCRKKKDGCYLLFFWFCNVALHITIEMYWSSCSFYSFPLLLLQRDVGYKNWQNNIHDLVDTSSNFPWKRNLRLCLNSSFFFPFFFLLFFNSHSYGAICRRV